MQLFLRSFLAAYPVRAGIVLGIGEKARGEKCFPRMRGDISLPPAERHARMDDSPRERGEFHGGKNGDSKVPNCPASAGIGLPFSRLLVDNLGVPRASGDKSHDALFITGPTFGPACAGISPKATAH